jgi:ABC-type glycerol-3-phosphate transport system permease component
MHNALILREFRKLPKLLFVLFFQRPLIRGLTFGAVKG